MAQVILHCPVCQSKVDEREIKENEIVKKRCEKCDVFFWVLGELQIRYLIDPKEVKNKQKA